MRQALWRHWPEYLCEAALLGLFLISACSFGVLLEHPDSPLRQALPNPWPRRLLMGLAMGTTAVLLIRSPWGQRSGAHMNPGTTFTFWRLGKVAGADAAAYITAQFLGAVGGVALAALVLWPLVAHPDVRYVVTQPGPAGPLVAFAAEAAISFLLMTTVLFVSNHARWSRYTPYCAGALVWLYITVEAPVSGMSMNAARTFGSAASAGVFSHLWIYFLAPVAGMLAAAEWYVRRRGIHRVFCAKLDHHNTARCIFRCRFGELVPLLLVLAGIPAMAQRHEVGLLLGVSRPAGRDLPAGRLRLDAGRTFAASYSVRLTTAAGIEFFFEVPFAATPQHRIRAPLAAATRDAATLYLMPGLRVKLHGDRRIQPYAAAGAGYALFEHSTTRLDGGANQAPRLAHRGGFQFGGGLDVRIHKHLLLRVEARDFVSGNPEFNVPLRGRWQHNLFAAGGLALRF